MRTGACICINFVNFMYGMTNCSVCDNSATLSVCFSPYLDPMFVPIEWVRFIAFTCTVNRYKCYPLV